MLRCCAWIILGVEIVHFSKFWSECTDISYVAGERVELTVHKESVFEEEIKEVELRSRRAQFIYDRNCNRIGLQLSGRLGHAPSRLLVKKLRHLLHKRTKVWYLYGRVSGKLSFLTIPPHLQLIHITTPKRTLHSVLLHLFLAVCLPFLFSLKKSELI